MPPTPLRVFVIDDQDIMRHGTCLVLAQDGEADVVGMTGDLGVAVDTVRAAEPSVVVIGTSGELSKAVAAVGRLRAGMPELRALVLSPAEAPDAIPQVVAAGGAGHLSRYVNGEQLLRALHATASGRTMQDPVDAVMALEKRRKAKEKPSVLDQLTATERKVIGLMAEGMSNREIAESLYVAEKTVRNHVTRILAKLGVERRTRAALIASELLRAEAS